MLTDVLRRISRVARLRSQQPITLGKWYFSCNSNALSHFFDQIEVAVISAKRWTRLTPILLLDLTHPTASDMEKIQWLESMGVTIHFHRAQIFTLIHAHFGDAANIFSGHWLRCDIPILETIDRFVLYTDIDVLFRKDVGLSDMAPRYLACAPEFERTELSYFNSGVMIMNVPALLKTRQRFIDEVARMLTSIDPFEDQKVFNAAYRNVWNRLPDGWNWKPYWGFDGSASIVHFHGPKLGMIRRMIAGDLQGIEAEYIRLYRQNPIGYAAYVGEIDALMATRGRQP